MPASTLVTAGDDILAAHHNTLRRDVLSNTSSHNHSGGADNGRKILPQYLASVSTRFTAGSINKIFSNSNSNVSRFHIHDENFVKFISMGEAILGPNATAIIALGAPAIALADAATGEFMLACKVPFGATSISSIKFFAYGSAAAARTAQLKFFTYKTTNAAAITSDVTDAMTGYTTAKDAPGVITVPAGAYNGLTITAGALFSINVFRYGGDAGDTVDSIMTFHGGCEIVFA